jgi:uncharacterized protein
MSAFEIGGLHVAAGTEQTVALQVSVLANSMPMKLPVHVVHGAAPGPVMFVSGVVHGDEIQGVEIVRQLLKKISAKTLSGTLLAVPIVNSFGFLNHSRYLPDRRDLNRSFPGSDQGSLAAQLADLFFREVVLRSQYGVDLHTAALHRTNLPQVRIAPGDDGLKKLAMAFAPPVVLTSKMREGSLRLHADKAGVKVLLFEGGEALRFEADAITMAVGGILRVMKHLGMIEVAPASRDETVMSTSSTWVRAPEGGILHSDRKIGSKVGRQQPIGIISDPLGQNMVSVTAEDDGIIIGRTHLPIVNRGDALFHVARIKPKGAAEDVMDEDEII